jgi:exonuclease III
LLTHSPRLPRCRRQGRHVIVLGDVNIAHTELDIYNPDVPHCHLRPLSVRSDGVRPEPEQLIACACAVVRARVW